MTRAALVLTALLLAGCGARSSSTPEDVARAWSAALNRNDNQAAAKLFGRDAQIVQDDELTLHSRQDAVMWNAALPCGGKITSVTRRNDTEVLVVFRLKERPGHVCDGPGQDAAAIIRVVRGRIVLWHQTGVPAGGDDDSGPVI